MKPLSPRERKLVAAGLLVAAFALLWLAIVQPIISGFSERDDRRESLIAQYQQNERLIGRIGALRRAAEDQNRLRSVYAIAAPDAVQGGERLKERLELSLEGAGGELRASESVDAPAGWVRASASALVSNQQLVAWLARLGNYPPYLVIESLTVGADRAVNSNRLDLMDVKIEASIPLGQNAAGASNPR